MVEQTSEIAFGTDNDGLESTLRNGPVIGYVGNDCSDDWMDIPTYRLIRDELLQLVCYWYTEMLNINFFFFLYQQRSGSECRRRSYAGGRIRRIEQLIGEKAVQTAIDAVEAEFAKTVNGEAWEVFCHGTPEQVEAFQDEIQVRMEQSSPPKSGVNSGEQCPEEPRSTGR